MSDTKKKLGSLPVWQPVLERLSDPVYSDRCLQRLTKSAMRL